MMLTRRTFALTSLGLAAAATLAACSSKSKDEATEEGKMALIVPDAGDAAAEALSKAVEAFTKETKGSRPSRASTSSSSTRPSCPATPVPCTPGTTGRPPSRTRTLRC